MKEMRTSEVTIYKYCEFKLLPPFRKKRIRKIMQKKFEKGVLI